MTSIEEKLYDKMSVANVQTQTEDVIVRKKQRIIIK